MHRVSHRFCHSCDVVIGLCGSICSGKSAAREYLASLGAVCVDVDKLAHSAYRKGSACYDAILVEFSETVKGSDGEIDRRLLGAEVFGRPERMKKLTDIVWPATEVLVESELQRLSSERRMSKEATAATAVNATSAASSSFVSSSSAAASEAAALPSNGEGTPIICVLEAAILLEAGWDSRCDEVWVTYVDDETAIQRLKVRNNLTEDAARARLASQMSTSTRLAHPSVSTRISTIGSVEETRKLIDAEWRALSSRIVSKTNATVAASES